MSIKFRGVIGGRWPAPYHFHECPGFKIQPNRVFGSHRRHDYPCYNPKCNSLDKRYCGIIVDAIWRGTNEKAVLNKKFI